MTTVSLVMDKTNHKTDVPLSDGADHLLYNRVTGMVDTV